MKFDVKDTSTAVKYIFVAIAIGELVSLITESTDLRYFDNIIPCGINDKAITSIENEIDKIVNMKSVENEIIKNLCEVFEFELNNNK